MYGPRPRRPKIRRETTNPRINYPTVTPTDGPRPDRWSDQRYQPRPHKFLCKLTPRSIVRHILDAIRDDVLNGRTTIEQAAKRWHVKPQELRRDLDRLEATEAWEASGKVRSLSFRGVRRPGKRWLRWLTLEERLAHKKLSDDYDKGATLKELADREGGGVTGEAIRRRIVRWRMSQEAQDKPSDTR